MNPFEKYLSKEDLLHKSVLDFVRYKYPHAIIAHPPNEGKRTPFERFKTKWLGISSGLPDLMIFSPSHSYFGLAIEIKVKPNKMTDSQLKWHENLFNCRWQCACVYNIDEAMDVINEYFNPATKKYGNN